MLYIHRNKISIVLIFLLLSNLAFAQKNNANYDKGSTPFHFGFHFGLNNSVFKTFPSKSFMMNDTLLNMRPQSGPGLQFGIISEARFNEYFSLRFIPSLMFVNRSIDFDFANPIYNVNKKVESTYISFPLLVKYSSFRAKNFRLYWIGGASYNIDMSSQEKVSSEVDRIKINKKSMNLEYGIGGDFYLPYFKFSPEIKIGHSLSNILINDNFIYSQSLDKLLSRTVMITFNFQ